ncbi:co-chaperone HscB [[Haemophilus] ducreyi]|uniref:Co-chaperone protein HscB homolog n=2 Tax=Haemophilus ducreyi TaxID=730 RepID=HSCB_HAEDU|nr:Fe-S protein assembly co-chaperone HscB [[Haemophilus] ducreyi]Q7VMA6.1 RecName: Full=Co-chaperone protein HscB homolog [[Haemophilus] ducreyi 35000HP]AAP95951.1 chaperone protein HscB [[Haemophilus] ducreyi 35000HP]AKO30957.1 co-chaperone HscB [[Haemophilus] ducreyi]AKO32396.1 co-chaperone HscB [[Haemophilus] ducreyi]AKO33848.1 co-chaperone HscB [[Haemophilus] ducreyi]AKO35294.1 co-chaperone HscB [[Haemophilus] ducreyi]
MRNPFSLFNLPVQFQIDNAQLSERYLALQKQFHPDNFANESADKQLAALQQSADVNEALQILKDPIARATAIIEINTGIVKNLEENSRQDLDFLMQHMEWHEKLDSIENSRSEQQLAGFLKQIKTEQRNVEQQLATLLNQQQWQKADLLTERLRYFKKLIIQIEKVEEKLLEY